MPTISPKIAPDRHETDPSLDRDLALLRRFVELYCQDHHAEAATQAYHFQVNDGKYVSDHSATLCPDCGKLLSHAMVKRSRCPMDPKPQCKHCPSHCYVPKYRQQMREVMKHSGRKLVMRGRLDYLLHLLF